MNRSHRTPWLALGSLATVFLLLAGARILHTLPVFLLACPLKAHLGLPCATCGLTRCLLALAGGHWGEAFHWHPVAMLLVLAFPLAMGWDLRRAWKGDPYPSLPDSSAARLSVAGLLAATWLLQIVRGI